MDDVTRQAFATTIGVVAAVFVSLLANLDQPYWAGLSALIISNVDRTALFTKGVLRICGTLVGVISGYFIAQWLQGLPLMEAVALMLAAAIGIYGRQRSPHGYAWFYGSISFMLVLVCSMTMPEELYAFAHFRCYEIMLGVAAATLASWAFGPRAGEWPKGLGVQPLNVTKEDALRQSVAAALGALCIVLIWSIFELPMLIQVLASSLIVVDSDPNATRHRGWQRIMGCIVGGIAGLLVIGINASNPVWWLFALSAGIFLFARVHLGKTPEAYVGTQAAVAYLLTMVGSGPPDSIMPPVNRLIGIVIGVSIMSLIVWALNNRHKEQPVPVKAG